MLKANEYRIIDCCSEVRKMYEFNGTTPRGERVVVEVTDCYPYSDKGWDKNGLPTLWYKAGYTKEVLPNYISVNTYVYEPDGSCFGMYNPQTCETWNGKRHVINFDWMLTVSDENRDRLLAEIVRRANDGTPTPMEAITEKVKQDFMADHKAFIWQWDEPKMRSLYTRHELIRHLLLSCEVYYDKNQLYAGDFYTRLHFIYPDVTEEEVLKVYDRYKDIVTKIYG